MENTIKEISVIVEDKKAKSEGNLSGRKKPKIRTKKINTETLKESMSDLSEQISEILQNIKSVGDFKLQQVQLAVEISAEGGVSLIGTAKAGVKGAVTLTFGV